MRKKSITIAATLLLIVILILVTWKVIYYIEDKKVDTKWDINELDLSNVNKLMIVAHPDDETLWGGGELINDNYLVICLTCGTNEIREKEFKEVMKKTGDDYIMLGYPDKTHGKRNDWHKHEKNIIVDLKEIIECKIWNNITTHNPDGEYGHNQHKLINQYVTNLVEDKNKLIYFGHYYSKDKIVQVKDELIKLDDSVMDYKRELISVYKSQGFLDDKFSQMYPYENYITYTEWGMK